MEKVNIHGICLCLNVLICVVFLMVVLLDSAPDQVDGNQLVREKILYGSNGISCFYWVKGNMAKSIHEIDCNKIPKII